MSIVYKVIFHFADDASSNAYAPTGHGFVEFYKK